MLMLVVLFVVVVEEEKKVVMVVETIVIVTSTLHPDPSFSISSVSLFSKASNSITFSNFVSDSVFK